MKQRGATLAVNCTGIRAAESSARSKQTPWRQNKRLSKAGRNVWDWMQIHAWSTERVFDRIAAAGQDPHWAYKDGNERLSCVFCIMGCRSDLRHGAQARPELYAKYVETEKRIGKTVFMKDGQPIPLEQHVGIPVTIRY